MSLLREHLAGCLDVWSADSGTFRPLLGKADDEALPDTCENLWLRASGADAWQYDVILMDTTPTTWTFKRDARISLPIDSILWTRDGIDYLRPEVQLLHKANSLRPKDRDDFAVCLPLLGAPARQWLKNALEVAHPGHSWLVELWTDRCRDGIRLRLPVIVLESAATVCPPAPRHVPPGWATSRLTGENVDVSQLPLNSEIAAALGRFFFAGNGPSHLCDDAAPLLSAVVRRTIPHVVHGRSRSTAAPP